jgi:hypothetical protein
MTPEEFKEFYPRLLRWIDCTLNSLAMPCGIGCLGLFRYASFRAQPLNEPTAALLK